MSEGANPDGVKPVISMRGVKRVAGGRVILDSVDLDVYPGETMVIMGGSGSGKSTMLRLMIGAITPEAGRVEMLGREVNPRDEMSMNDLRKRFGILFQSGALFNSMTIADNIALMLHEHTDLPRELIDFHVKLKLEAVGLLEHAGKYPAEISGGMKKRAGLARALALDPVILFYDEPSAGLDPVTSAQIDQLIVKLSKQLNVTSVVVTHEMDSAFAIADRMAMLDSGRMLAVEPKAWYDRLRRVPAEEAEGLGERERLIRQFLRGDAEGPLGERRTVEAFMESLLGVPGGLLPTPSVEPTRVR
ncbi:MAG: ATP-binding cassette domain-containing protein [Phycisphaeraceae bacterium]|nr:MAG: ATP-binding cassette domain-containing protein [Phycisphaeraceae bacterium]